MKFNQERFYALQEDTKLYSIHGKEIIRCLLSPTVVGCHINDIRTIPSAPELLKTHRILR